MAAAGAKVAQKEAAAEAKRRADEDDRKAKKRAVDEAISELRNILRRLFDEIATTSEMAHKGDKNIRLGEAELAYETPIQIEANGSQSGWDVLAGSTLRVSCQVDRQAHHEPPTYTYSATLAYAKVHGDTGYRWREVSFFDWSGRSSKDAPIALGAGSAEFHVALSKVVSGWQTAFGPVSIDGEDEEAFADRWIKLFVKAVDGRLIPPTSLPLTSSYFS